MSQNIHHTQIAIIGGGISGLCTAYFLLKAGFEVTICEQHSNVAENGTLGNSGLLAPASTLPLSIPNVLSTAFKSRFASAPAVLPAKSPSLSRWSWQRKTHLYIQHNFQTLKENLSALTAMGTDLIKDIQTLHALDHENVSGVFSILHKPDEVTRFEQSSAFLKDNDYKYQYVDAEQIHAAEPAFSTDCHFIQAHFYPEDGAGNCVLFAKQLKQLILELNGLFVFGQPVKTIETAPNGELYLHHDNGHIHAEAVIVCAGDQSGQLLKPLGIHLPLQQIDSYQAVSVLKNDEYAPNHTFIDNTYRISMTRLGNRIRLSGLLGFPGEAGVIPQKAAKSLLKFAQEFFPHTINYDALNVIARPYAMSATGLPLIGTTNYSNLFINTAHGVNGWATAAAAAKLLTEHILGDNKTINSPLLFSHFDHK